MRLKSVLLLAAMLAAPVVAQRATAPFTVAETGQGFSSLQQAVTAVGDGDATIVIAPGTYRDCASQRGGRITYRAATPGTAARSTSCWESPSFLYTQSRPTMLFWPW